MPDDSTDRAFMTLAIEQAERAAALGDVPIGCVVVSGAGQLLSRAHNRRELDQDPVAHAEILALQAAAQALGSWRLIDTTLYVTVEPCTMCAGALVWSRVKRLVYGCPDPKAGAVESLYQICTDPRLNHRLEVTAGVEAARCAALLRDFFQALRGVE